PGEASGPHLDAAHRLGHRLRRQRSRRGARDRYRLHRRGARAPPRLRSTPSRPSPQKTPTRRVTPPSISTRRRRETGATESAGRSIVSELQPVRGTHDLLPEDMRRHRRVIDCARDAAERYGYLDMATPVFEFSEVFKRTLGDTSDIVTKEMYTFTDKGGDQLTLRPENTAGVARAFTSGGLSKHLPLKYFYAGPMFRYERPQKGRQRQFHQIGVELLGMAGPAGDVEIIAC